jgi:hypothetical protein
VSAGHPSALELEAWHAGERQRDLSGHVAACVVCRGRLEELDGERAAFLQRIDPEDYLRTLRARVDDADAQASRSGSRADPRASTPRRRRALVSAALVLAASAALGWLPREPGPAAASGRSAVEERHASAPELAPKGHDTELAVIRLRAGEQSWQRRSAWIAPGDKLRVAVQLARPRHLVAGVLAEDGSWLPLFDRHFAAGRHVPEATLQIDARPASGRLLLGAAEDVAAARRGLRTGRVESLELVWSPTP